MVKNTYTLIENGALKISVAFTINHIKNELVKLHTSYIISNKVNLFSYQNFVEV